MVSCDVSPSDTPRALSSYKRCPPTDKVQRFVARSRRIHRHQAYKRKSDNALQTQDYREAESHANVHTR
jgi:hypothetical protein